MLTASQSQYHHWHLPLLWWGSLLTRDLLSTGDRQSGTQTPARARRDACIAVRDVCIPRSGGKAPVWDWRGEQAVPAQRGMGMGRGLGRQRACGGDAATFVIIDQEPQAAVHA